MPRPRDSKDPDPRVVGLWFVLVIALMIMIYCVHTTFLNPQSGASDLGARAVDCVQAAPSDCQTNTIELSHQRTFSGYLFCACITKGNKATGYIAADTRIYPNRRKAWRPPAPAYNDNPAVTFPVGAPHR